VQLFVQAVVGKEVFTSTDIVHLQLAQQGVAVWFGQQAKNPVPLEAFGECAVASFGVLWHGRHFLCRV
jgi:hypothetical protein